MKLNQTIYVAIDVLGNILSGPDKKLMAETREAIEYDLEAYGFKDAKIVEVKIVPTNGTESAGPQ